MERAIREKWSARSVAEKLDVPIDAATRLLSATQEALAIVDAENPAESFRKAEPGMVIDFEQNGRAIVIEMTAPTMVTASDLNRVLTEFGAPPITREDLAPLKAA